MNIIEQVKQTLIDEINNSIQKRNWRTQSKFQKLK